MTDPRVDQLHDHLTVQHAIIELFLATDLKAWDRAKASFADEVQFDMTSLAGGEPTTMTPDAIANAWAEGLETVEAVHHDTSNFVIDVNGDIATVTCYGTATHFNPLHDKRLTYFVGSYDFQLRRGSYRWKIDHFRFTKKYVEAF